MHKPTKKAATVQPMATSKTNTFKYITVPSQRPTPKGRLVASMASKFWRPIVLAQLERGHAGQAGAGDAIVKSRAETAGGRDC